MSAKTTKKLSSSLVKLLKFGVSILILFIIWQKFELDFSKLQLGQHSWKTLLAACLFPLAILPFFSVNRWQVFLKASGINETFLRLWCINLKSMFIGIVLPSTQGFDLVRMYFIEKLHPENMGKGGSTIVIERFFGVLLLCLYSLLALPFVIKEKNILPVAFIIILVVLAGLLGVIFVTNPSLYKLYSGKRTSFALINRGIVYVEGLHGALIQFPYKKIFFSSVIFISGFQLGLVFCVYLVFSAYGYPLPFIKHLALYPVISVLAMMPVTIGGFGVREGLFVYFYGTLGIPEEVSFAVSVTNYAIITLLPATIGAFVYLHDTCKTKKHLTLPANHEKQI